MPARRRADDDQAEDHVSERSWVEQLPRRSRDFLLVASVGLNGMLGSALMTMGIQHVQNKYDELDRKWSDKKWETIATHGEDIGKLKAVSDQHGSDLLPLRKVPDQMAQMQQQLLSLQAAVNRIERGKP
jgi:hypothetical protein